MLTGSIVAIVIPMHEDGSLDLERFHQLIEERFLATQLMTMASCAADDSTQHITAPFVRWQNTIYDQKSTGANMVGNNAQRLVFQVFCTR